MKRFDESVLHVNANEDNHCLGCIGAHEIQYKLNLIDENIFPLLKDDSIQTVEIDELTDEGKLDALLDTERVVSDEKNTGNESTTF